MYFQHCSDLYSVSSDTAVPEAATGCQYNHRRKKTRCRLYHSIEESNVSLHLLFTLSRTVQFVPEVEHTALEKVRATKQQTETLQETSCTWGDFNFVHVTAAVLKFFQNPPVQHIQFPIYLLINFPA